MPVIDLSTLVDLVGTLDDSSDSKSAAIRFRTYLQEHVQSVSDVRAYTNAALSTKGDQYDKAFQDIINHIGRLLGFEVTFGRYRGVAGVNGFDGLWQSPSGKTVVVETKTTDSFTVKTATLLDYIHDLVSEGQLPNYEEALGLYVYGRFDRQASQLENTIIAERQQQRLRVASSETLLYLLELKQGYEVNHQTIFQLLLPSPVRVDTVVNLIFDVVSRAKGEVAEQSTDGGAESTQESQQHSQAQEEQRRRGRPRKQTQAPPLTGEAAEIDTVVIPAKEEGFRRVFLGEKRWHAIRIGAVYQPKLKYIAVYQVAPVSAITYIASIQSIEPWEKTGKLVVNFAGAPQRIAPIPLADNGRVHAPQNLRYTNRQKLTTAKNLDDLW
jgi:hypothetical protein